MSDELTSALVSLLVVALVGALAPFIVALVPRLRVPQVVVLIVGGIIVGPQVMHLAEPKASSCCPTSAWGSSFSSPA
jgi:Kef-type K+ transport system membrane component KefB